VTSHLQSIYRVLGLNEQRKARNMLLQAAFQLKLPFYILLLSVVFLSLCILLGNIYFQQTYNSMLATSTQPDYLQQVIAQQAHEFKMLSLLLLAVYAALVSVVATLFTHRLIGPILPIRRHIRALQEGRYGQRVKLRKHDGLQDVADELNRLAETLEQGRSDH
jgi:HAMP domain-containing protein